jgi:Protein of unknown function (DUF3631)
MMSTDYKADPTQIDPLKYLAEVNGHQSPEEYLEHYHVLRPALLRLQRENPPAFDLVIREISTRLKIKGKTVLTDLAALTLPQAANDTKELLKAMGQIQPLRLAQDLRSGVLWFGVIAGEMKLLVNSRRELLTLDKLPDGLRVRDQGFDLCRISKEAILRFVGGEVCSDLELLVDLQAYFSRFAVFRDRRIPLLLAVWTLGTYCYRVFRVFAYLALRSPDKRCGKSRVLDLLSLVAFNASSRVVHPTEAQVFRGPSRNGGTLLLDEIEALGRADKDTYAGLLAVLNSGFEQGGSVPRLEKTATGSFREVTFETYCPRAIAGINKLADTLEDRSIIVVMQRKLAREKTERFSPTRLDSVAQTLRDRCYLWALTHAEDLHEVYEAADKTFTDLDWLDDRARDLWEPLVSIAAISDLIRGDETHGFTVDLIELARDLGQVREATIENSISAQIIQALWRIADQEGAANDQADIALAPKVLADRLQGELGWNSLSTRHLATILTPLGLHAQKTRQGTKVIRAYHLKPSELAELCERYGNGDEKGNEKHV